MFEEDTPRPAKVDLERLSVDELKARAAALWETDADSVEFADGAFTNKKEPEQRLTFKEAAAKLERADEIYFQIPRAIADKFADAVNRTAGDGEDGEDIRIEASATGPRDVARTNRKAHPGAHRDGKPKPHRKNFGGKPKGDFKGNRSNKPPKGAKKKDR